MPCGHGGICEECALGIFEKADQCPFCRKVIKFDEGNYSSPRN